MPSRFKKEILNQLIRQKIELHAKGQYKITVDYGPVGANVTAQTSTQDAASVERRKFKDKMKANKSSNSPKRSGVPKQKIALPKIDQKHLP